MVHVSGLRSGTSFFRCSFLAYSLPLVGLSFPPQACFHSLMALPGSPVQRRKASGAIAAAHSVVRIGSYCQTLSHLQLDVVTEAQEVRLPAGSVAAARRSPSACFGAHP